MAWILRLLFVAVLLSGTAWAQSKQIARLAQMSDALENITQQVSPAVVQILATGYGTVRQDGSGQGTLLRRERSTGSGVIVSAEGDIITNAHVVAGARRIQIVLPVSVNGGRTYRSIIKPGGRMVGAQLVNLDRETDLAVLKIQEKGLPYLMFADSDLVHPGEVVLAFGSPRGLENSVSLGVVSAVARQFKPDAPMIYLQTDAAINPGNSGGPLVNTDGKIIGINTLIFSQSGGSEGLGFAAPSNIVRSIYTQIKEKGYVQRGQIGVAAQTITPLMARGLGLARDWGVVIADVAPGGPASRAGLLAGDIVLQLDQKDMENARQFNVNIYQRRVGHLVRLHMQRQDSTFTTEVRVHERDDDPDRFASMVSPSRNLIPELGILALDLNAKTVQFLPRVRRPFGVIVASRAAHSPFLEDGLEPGDVIYMINQEIISDITGLKEKLARFKYGDAVTIQIERRGVLRYIACELERE